MSTTIYTVEGSEDGLIDAVTSATRAARRAIEYAGDGATLWLGTDFDQNPPASIDEAATVRNVRRKVLDNGLAIVSADHGGHSATVQRWED